MKRLNAELLDYYDKEVVNIILNKYNLSPIEALRQFVMSQTHEMLEDAKYELWEFGPEGIVDMWEAEKITGNPRNSIYIRGE